MNSMSRRDKPKSRPANPFSQEESLSVKNVPSRLPENEEKRIQKIRDYQILDTPASPTFDDLSHLASLICNTPIILITLVDRDRQWFKSKIGLDVSETSRESSFCSHAILEPDKVLVVEDSFLDERFSRNELVLDGPQIRFYAGAPLVTPDGFALGTICAIDQKPRQLDPQQQKALQIIANQVVAQMEVHRQLLELHEAKEYAESLCISSFENLLLSSVGILAFEEFLQAEFCVENLQFWKEARQFPLLHQQKTLEERALTTTQLVEIFIKENSPKQINIHDSTRKQIQMEAERPAEEIPITIFEEAKKEVFALMKRDSYQKFLSSPQYKSLMATIREVGVMRLNEN